MAGEKQRQRRIFIGSSTESRPVAEAIRKALEGVCECVTWYESFFSEGDYVFSNLIQKMISFDYAIMVGAPDDRVERISTGAERLSPRDNVYIEFGLFSGTLAPKRVLFLKDRRCTEASDLRGILFGEYSETAEAVALATDWVKRHLRGEQEVCGRDEIDLLPTAGVAIGYYCNFVEPLAYALADLEAVTLEDAVYPVNARKMHICVPNFVSDKVDRYVDHIRRSRGLKDVMIGRRRVLVDPVPLAEGRLEVYDVPTTLLAVFQTVNHIFNESTRNTPDMLCAKQRALDNFFDLVASRVADNFEVDEIVQVERYEK